MIKYSSFVIVLFFFFCFSSFGAKQIGEKDFVVILDAGHGGKDTGNRGGGYFEKKIALSIVLKVGKLLGAVPGVKVIYTRKSDVFIELEERARIANDADADLFVSVHCDAFKREEVFGAGTFVLGLHANERNFRIAQKENSVIFFEKDFETKYDGFDPNDPESVISLVLMQETYLNQSIQAADFIQKSFVNSLERKDRTVKQAGFLVLRNTYMPSVLVETGFLTNKREGAYLNTNKGQSEMARSIFKGILEYKKAIENSVAGSEKEKIKLAKEKANKSETQNNKNVEFKIQLFVTSRKLQTSDPEFKGLSPISSVSKSKKNYYYYGSAKTYEQVEKLKLNAVNKGFKTAFVVAFKKGKKVKLSSVLK